MRDAIGRPIPRMPCLEDMDRDTDEAYERHVAEEEEQRIEGYAQTRKFIPPEAK